MPRQCHGARALGWAVDIRGYRVGMNLSHALTSAAPAEVLTVPEAARLLRVNHKTLREAYVLAAPRPDLTPPP